MIGRAAYNNKTDVWSTGVVFIEMMTLKVPEIVLVDFKALDPKSVQLPNENDDPRLVALCQFICSKMVVGKERKRASIGEIIASPEFSEQFALVSRQAKEWLHGDDKVSESIKPGLKNEIKVDPGDKLVAKLKLSTKQVDRKSQVGFNLNFEKFKRLFFFTKFINRRNFGICVAM